VYIKNKINIMKKSNLMLLSLMSFGAICLLTTGFLNIDLYNEQPLKSIIPIFIGVALGWYIAVNYKKIEL
jgi:hypothetical protein